MTDSVFRTGKNYYPQVFKEEYKYPVKKIKMTEYIADDIEASFDDSDREDSDEEIYNEENSDKENYDVENQKNIHITHSKKSNKIFFVFFFFSIYNNDKKIKKSFEARERYQNLSEEKR